MVNFFSKNKTLRGPLTHSLIPWKKYQINKKFRKFKKKNFLKFLIEKNCFLKNVHKISWNKLKHFFSKFYNSFSIWYFFVSEIWFKKNLLSVIFWKKFYLSTEISESFFCIKKEYFFRLKISKHFKKIVFLQIFITFHECSQKNPLNVTEFSWIFIDFH